MAFASGTAEENARLIAGLAAWEPGWPLYVVAEFAPEHGVWIPYHVYRSYAENLAACRAVLRGLRVGRAEMVLSARVPYGRMLRVAVAAARGRLRVRVGAGFGDRWTRPAGRWMRRLGRPGEARVPLLAKAAQISGGVAARFWGRREEPATRLPAGPCVAGVSVVIPSRSGRGLLEEMLPALLRHGPDEVIVVDNGSDDGSVDWLRSTYSGIRVEESVGALSFADAVNRGIAAARFSHILLLNNDMIAGGSFLEPLRRAFGAVPELFCATAQIFFPAGVRREETGKAVMRQVNAADFPIRCEEPIAGEDQTWVLYGSGGCSLYDAAKLRALGGVNPIYRPAYVEDLDLGYRGWLRGWPSVFVAEATVEHRHRSTTSRYFTPAQLDAMVQTNYLRFVASAVASPVVFQRLWSAAVRRLHLAGMEEPLRAAAALPWHFRGGGSAVMDEEEFLALTAGDVAVFPGRARREGTRVLIASPYVPFPLSHGGAVRMFHLMRGAAGDCCQVLVVFCDELRTPPEELLAICAEVVLVRRLGTHYRKSTERPDTVEEFDSPAFHAAVRASLKKWRPAIAQLEFTQMAQYAEDCAPAKTILVEHDITFDLQEQLLRASPGEWELERQLGRWRAYETSAWKRVDCVVTMSEKDRAVVGSGAVCLPNGVDTDRFRPAGVKPEPGRLLFIGSFAHLPNVLAVEFFLREVWPLLPGVTLHVIAGAGHERFRNIEGAGITVEDFVADVRPAYAAAAVVIAPLTVSAGTNIKILEALAMGKAVVSTRAGINGLELVSGRDLLVADGAEAFAEAVQRLLADRAELERGAREAALRFDWSTVRAGTAGALQEAITKASSMINSRFSCAVIRR